MSDTAQPAPIECGFCQGSGQVDSGMWFGYANCERCSGTGRLIPELPLSSLADVARLIVALVVFATAAVLYVLISMLVVGVLYRL